ncbi:MAG: alpha/beta hydrolase [Gammaproteobacteria bacterium]
MKHMQRILIFSCCLAITQAMAQIRTDCQGEGPMVYLIGGGPAFTTWNLTPIQQRLHDHFKVCRWDMRGVGDNAALEINPHIPVLQQWLHDMAETLPDEPVVLWGHSWGALQALLFARQYPHRVRALVLNNPVDPELKSLEDIEFKRYVHPFVESHLGIDDIDTPIERRHRFRSKIASYFLDAEKGWAYSAKFNEDDANNELNVRIWREYRDMSLTHKDFELLAPLVQRLIYCQYDVLMPKSYEVYSGLIASTKHDILEDCAHFPWVESPQAFYPVLLQAITEAYR